MNNPRESKKGFTSFSKASHIDNVTSKHPTQSSTHTQCDSESMLENFPTEETKFRIKPRKIQNELNKDEALEKFTDRNSLLYIYHDMRKNNPTLLDLMAMGQDEMDEPLPQ